MGCSRQELGDFLDDLLQPQRFSDYCPNGLQVEGRDQIEHLVCGVTASQALIDAAASAGADALLVHHGYFWRSESPTVTGMKARRIRALMQADINLFAYHLPLDCHPELGNNACLGRLLELPDPRPLDPGDENLPLFTDTFNAPVAMEVVVNRLAAGLDREPLSVGEGSVQSVVWCTGAGQNYIDRAADAGADLFVTGEVSEQTIHIARERGLCFIAAGHHATERYGIQAVTARAAKALGCSYEYIEIDNPA